MQSPKTTIVSFLSSTDILRWIDILWLQPSFYHSPDIALLAPKEPCAVAPETVELLHKRFDLGIQLKKNPRIETFAIKFGTVSGAVYSKKLLAKPLQFPIPVDVAMNLLYIL